jgi:hypothetical protein
MTSNVGSHRILEYRGAFEGEAYERMKQAVLEEMRRHFRPEFLNRVDVIIVFHALSEEHLKQIVEIQLGYLRKRLAERHIQIELTDAAREYLVRIGYDPTYGARPLKRAIQKDVETPPGAADPHQRGARRPDGQRRLRSEPQGIAVQCCGRSGGSGRLSPADMPSKTCRDMPAVASWSECKCGAVSISRHPPPDGQTRECTGL